MGTEDESVAANVSLTPAEALSRFDTVGLRRDFERLSVDDLTALASFPVEPHALIGRVVAVTHCLLLSLAPEHSTLELCPPPWALLRLQFLDNTVRIWRKLRKRAWQLETGVKSLSTAQIRYGCKELIPYVLPPTTPTNSPSSKWQLNKVAPVSTIAASLSAWAVFCLWCSVTPSTLTNLRLYEVSADQTTPQLSRSPSKSKSKNHSPTLRALNNVSSLNSDMLQTSNSVRRHSKRIGTKIGGRFMLFHTRFTSSTQVLSPGESVGEWSVYCLDVNRVGRKQQHPSSTNTSWWTRFHPIDVLSSASSPSFTLSQLPPLAQQSLLLQLGFHDHVFERPTQDIPFANSPGHCRPVFSLKFGVVGIDSHQLYLVAVGNAFITMETTVADLRFQLTSPTSSSLCSSLNTEANFRFAYCGSFLATSQENCLAAAALSPFVILAIVPHDNSLAEYRKNKLTSQLWCHYYDVAQSLVNAGVPDHLPQLDSKTSNSSISKAVTVFPVRRLITTRPTNNTTVHEISTASAIVEFFTHWRAFVHFQQLQDAAILFQLQQRSPRKKIKVKKLPANLSNGGDPESENVPYGPQPEPLPHKKFNSNKEWLLPLHAVVDVATPTTATLRTPFRDDVNHALASRCRLVLSNDEHVVHVTQVNLATAENDAFGINLTVFDVGFKRDESCPLESLIQLKDVYAWIIMPRKSRGSGPPEWLCSLYRFVQHPKYDFLDLHEQQFQYFRVRGPWHLVERRVEAAFWSKVVDWKPIMANTELHSTILRKIFDTMCHSHPPALGVDSVKFSKLLYEASIQPSLLTIGDAAFLFASNIMLGSSYEMNFDGFVCAMEWLAQEFYSDTIKVKPGKSSPNKSLAGVQHAMLNWQRAQRNSPDDLGQLLSPLRRLCFETLVHLPSLSDTWHEIMNSWRLASKQNFMQEFAVRYCASTRLRAVWIGFITWRKFSRLRQRMKDERLAATKLQSIARGRRQYLEYYRVRRVITRIQLRIRARFELRRLRAEHVAFIERMRVRMVKWMRYHLWMLHEWNRVNPEKAARRERIRQKRLRRLGVAVFPLDSKRIRFSLYRAALEENIEGIDTAPTTIGNMDSQDVEPVEAYELEVVDASHSWGQVFATSEQQINQFNAEEMGRVALQGFAGLDTVKNLSARDLFQDTKRDSIVNPVSKPNIVMLALARRLEIHNNPAHTSTTLRCYSDPADTSLGKLIFKGAVRSVHNPTQEQQLVQQHVMRVLEWAGIFKFMLYTPCTSAKRRYDLPPSFIHSVLCFVRFNTMTLGPEDRDGLVEAVNERPIDKPKLHNADSSKYIRHRIHHILAGTQKLTALRCIVNYVLQYGVCLPKYSMMPHVVAEQKRQHDERSAAERDARIARELQLIVKVQSHARQYLAKKARQNLALASYSKQFDVAHKCFVYVRHRPSGATTILGKRKPFSLFDEDVPPPEDQWQRCLDNTNDEEVCFFNPRRGVYSRYDHALAAISVQRWFRRKMWNGVNDWKLRDTACALRYHHNVQKPNNVADLMQLEDLKRYTLQLHALQHQYKEAFTMYEAALKISPSDLQSLVGLAVLLVVSCRYPLKQSWGRALNLLQQARTSLSGDLASALREVEQNGFRWSLFLQMKNPHAIANYAAFLQCVHLDIDKAELLYRRALDLDPDNDLFVTNFQRIRSERAPGGVYAFAGPGKIALARSLEIRRVDMWREMADPKAQRPMPKRFFQDLRTGQCTWEMPNN